MDLSNSKIEQHIYTRAKRTMFRQTEGYGTVAKSAGVGEAFIKEWVHPYCVYPTLPATQELRDCSPPAISVVHYPCGRMLLGRAVYVSTDFTGQRAAFFAHNYILPPEVVGGVLQDFGKLRNVKFLCDYDVGQGDLLDCLPGLCIMADKKTNWSEKPTSWFSEICNDRLQHMVQCVTSSVYNGKKTFVILPVGVRDSHEYAWDLLTKLYATLPEGIKHMLGFCTYACEPVNKKGLHLIFMKKDAVRLNDIRMAKDFVIDLNAVFSTDSARKNCPPLISEGARKGIDSMKFFQEYEFWHARTPYEKEKLFFTEREWLDANLDKLTLEQYIAVPGAFVMRGKNSHQPELYVMLGILKTCAGSIATGRPLELRYFLGSYNLVTKNHFRIVQNLRRLYQNFITPSNYENIKFLFSISGEGRLDENGLKEYLKKFASGLECMEQFVL